MALTWAQHERELERIMTKQARGEKLTKKEWRILAYGKSPGCARCGVQLR